MFPAQQGAAPGSRLPGNGAQLALLTRTISANVQPDMAVAGVYRFGGFSGRGETVSTLPGDVFHFFAGGGKPLTRRGGRQRRATAAAISGCLACGDRRHSVASCWFLLYRAAAVSAADKVVWLDAAVALGHGVDSDGFCAGGVDARGLVLLGSRYGALFRDGAEVCGDVSDMHQTLPLAAFGRMAFGDKRTCPVCLDCLTDGHAPCLFLRCRHAMHAKCAAKLMNCMRRCPECRAQISARIGWVPDLTVCGDVEPNPGPPPRKAVTFALSPASHLDGGLKADPLAAGVSIPAPKATPAKALYPVLNGATLPQAAGSASPPPGLEGVFTVAGGASGGERKRSFGAEGAFFRRRSSVSRIPVAKPAVEVVGVVDLETWANAAASAEPLFAQDRSQWRSRLLAIRAKAKSFSVATPVADLIAFAAEIVRLSELRKVLERARVYGAAGWWVTAFDPIWPPSPPKRPEVPSPGLVAALMGGADEMRSLEGSPFIAPEWAVYLQMKVAEASRYLECLLRMARSLHSDCSSGYYRGFAKDLVAASGGLFLYAAMDARIGARLTVVRDSMAQFVTTDWAETLPAFEMMGFFREVEVSPKASRGIYQAVKRMLLVMAGVERNPGPTTGAAEFAARASRRISTHSRSNSVASSVSSQASGAWGVDWYRMRAAKAALRLRKPLWADSLVAHDAASLLRGSPGPGDEAPAVEFDLAPALPGVSQGPSAGTRRPGTRSEAGRSAIEASGTDFSPEGDSRVRGGTQQQEGNGAQDRRTTPRRAQRSLAERASLVAVSLASTPGACLAWLIRTAENAAFKQAVFGAYSEVYFPLWSDGTRQREGEDPAFSRLCALITHELCHKLAHQSLRVDCFSASARRERVTAYAGALFPETEWATLESVATTAELRSSCDGYSEYLQATRNSIMHALNGNTTSAPTDLRSTLRRPDSVPATPNFDYYKFDPMYATTEQNRFIDRTLSVEPPVDVYRADHTQLGTFILDRTERAFCMADAGIVSISTYPAGGFKLATKNFVSAMLEGDVVKLSRDQPVAQNLPMADLAALHLTTPVDITINPALPVLRLTALLEEVLMIQDLGGGAAVRWSSTEFPDVRGPDGELLQPVDLVDLTPEHASVVPGLIAPCFDGGELGSLTISARASSVPTIDHGNMFVLPTDAILATPNPAATTALLITIVSASVPGGWQVVEEGRASIALSGLVHYPGRKHIHVVFPARTPVADERRDLERVLDDVKQLLRFGPRDFEPEDGALVTAAAELDVARLARAGNPQALGELPPAARAYGVTDANYRVSTPGQRHIYPLSPFIYSWERCYSVTDIHAALAILNKYANGDFLVPWALDTLAYISRGFPPLCVYTPGAAAAPARLLALQRYRADGRCIVSGLAAGADVDALLVVPDFDIMAWNKVTSGIASFLIDGSPQPLPAALHSTALLADLDLRARMAAAASDAVYRYIGFPIGLYFNDTDPDLQQLFSLLYHRASGRSFSLPLFESAYRAAHVSLTGWAPAFEADKYPTWFGLRLRPQPQMMLGRLRDLTGDEYDCHLPQILSDVHFSSVCRHDFISTMRYRQRAIGDEMRTFAGGDVICKQAFFEGRAYYSVPIPGRDLVAEQHLRNSVYVRDERAYWNTFLTLAMGRVTTPAAMFQPRYLNAEPVEERVVLQGQFVIPSTMAQLASDAAGEVVELISSSRGFCGLTSRRRRVEFFCDHDTSRLIASFLGGKRGAALPYIQDPTDMYVPSDYVGDPGRSAIFSVFGDPARDFADGPAGAPASGSGDTSQANSVGAGDTRVALGAAVPAPAAPAYAVTPAQVGAGGAAPGTDGA